MKKNLCMKIIEKDEVDTIFMDMGALGQYSPKAVITALDILLNNNRHDNYIALSDELIEYREKQKEYVSCQCQGECHEFQDWSHVYFKHMTGPLYADANQVFEYIEKIYSMEHYFEHILPCSDNAIDILWRVHKAHDWQVSVKNAVQLCEKFGKAQVLHSLLLFKDALNNEHKINSKTNKEPFIIDEQMYSIFYNEEKGQHEYLEKFKSKDYFLSSFFDQACRKMTCPEEILRLVVICEKVRVENESEQSRAHLRM